MAPRAAGVRERRRTYEGCRDLCQTRSVLAAVPGGGLALREREPLSFEPMREDLRICFERPEDGQEPRVNRAWDAPHIAAQHIVVHCSMASLRDGVKEECRALALFSRRRQRTESSAIIDGRKPCTVPEVPD